MKELRPWQIAVMAAAVLVLGVSVYFQMTDESKVIRIADRVTVVDVETGDLFETAFPSGRAVVYPAKSPSNGQMAVFPVQNVGDKWVIPDRFLDQVRDYYKGKSSTGKVDLKGGEVSVANGTPKPADVF